MSISTPYASTISSRKRRRMGDSPTQGLHEALYTKALHDGSAYDGSAYDGSTTEALYKALCRVSCRASPELRAELYAKLHAEPPYAELHEYLPNSTKFC